MAEKMPQRKMALHEMQAYAGGDRMNILKALEICKAERDRMAEARGGDYSGVEALTTLMDVIGAFLNTMNEYAEQALLNDADRARWLPNFRYGMYKSEKFFICSKCKEQNMEKSAYCPHCGREMQNHE